MVQRSAGGPGEVYRRDRQARTPYQPSCAARDAAGVSGAQDRRGDRRGATACVPQHPRNDPKNRTATALERAGASSGDLLDSPGPSCVRQAFFPKALPRVTETGGKIPRTPEYHVNQTDHTFCLGSPLSLLLKLSKKPTLDGFAENCLVPYLFAVSRKLLQGGDFTFGELAHGSLGEIADYTDLFGLQTADQVMRTIRYLGMKKRRANKLLCPCECGRRLGACSFNRRVRGFRQLAGRRWFRNVASDLPRINRGSGLATQH